MTKFVSPGKHVLLDFHQAKNLRDIVLIEKILRDAAAVCGASILQVVLHEFGEGDGVTGVAILAESHISIHTWPEIDFAAIDIFMCGTSDLYKAIPILKTGLCTMNVKIGDYARGQAYS